MPGSPWVTKLEGMLTCEEGLRERGPKSYPTQILATDKQRLGWALQAGVCSEGFSSVPSLFTVSTLSPFHGL